MSIRRRFAMCTRTQRRNVNYYGSVLEDENSWSLESISGTKSWRGTATTASRTGSIPLPDGSWHHVTWHHLYRWNWLVFGQHVSQVSGCVMTCWTGTLLPLLSALRGLTHRITTWTVRTESISPLTPQRSKHETSQTTGDLTRFTNGRSRPPEVSDANTMKAHYFRIDTALTCAHCAATYGIQHNLERRQTINLCNAIRYHCTDAR